MLIVSCAPFRSACAPTFFSNLKSCKKRLMWLVVLDACQNPLRTYKRGASAVAMGLTCDCRAPSCFGGGGVEGVRGQHKMNSLLRLHQLLTRVLGSKGWLWDSVPKPSCACSGSNFLQHTTLTTASKADLAPVAHAVYAFPFTITSETLPLLQVRARTSSVILQPLKILTSPLF